MHGHRGAAEDEVPHSSLPASTACLPFGIKLSSARGMVVPRWRRATPRLPACPYENGQALRSMWNWVHFGWLVDDDVDYV
jgi:hypothetical protein